MALTLLGAIFVGFSLASLAFDQLDIQGRDEVIERAADALAVGGKEGLSDWLESNPTPSPGIMLLVLDASGQDLLDRPLPQRFRRLLRAQDDRAERDRGRDDRADGGRDDRAERDRGRNRGPPNFRPPEPTATLVGPDGEELRLVFVRTQITVLGILSWPATQFAVLILAVLAAALTSLMLARYLSSPVVRLQRATRALAAGALDARVGKPFNQRRDEVGTLARDFDAMAEQIQTLVTNKDTLLRDVSHELRSPLARIRVALALAQRKSGDSAQPDLGRIEQEAENLDDLIGQILALVRLRTMSTDHGEQIELADLIREVVDNARFEEAGMNISVTTAPVPSIRGNRTELTSAIENILRNAMAHSEPDGEITVVLAHKDAKHEITISDRGPGVPPDALKRLFEPFFRVDASRDHQQTGYGLGLAIAASVIEKHGGDVTARNRAGGGLAVTLSLTGL
jgi:two-component system sensor histidine kinase CpxA